LNKIFNLQSSRRRDSDDIRKNQFGVKTAFQIQAVAFAKQTASQAFKLSERSIRRIDWRKEIKLSAKGGLYEAL